MGEAEPLSGRRRSLRRWYRRGRGTTWRCYSRSSIDALTQARGAEHDWPENNLVVAMARMARMQSAATPHEIGPRLLAEACRFPGRARQAFRQGLYAWASSLWIDKTGAEAAFPSFEELEQEEQEMATALQVRWARHEAELRAEAHESGFAEGRELGLLQGLEQGRDQGRDQGRKHGRELGLLQGLEQGLEQGRKLGLVQGYKLGRADERNGLRRQATLKFGAGTAVRLADRLADLTTFEDLDRVADWIIECESGDELLSRLRSIAST